ncbi:reverse transcriptase [Cucumis melo var. makuwa]|uniref:Reverse transcriptase n=1 Tax=Cucumis melo var. makuwa TaxID=1194695 RepID=A0A5D3D4S6_CUCMM|nr:reverse transcriptase [Cucumis melo var. makuwa]TYK18549.1 reverse transcriptase [Cucumis melo var. makuwa]
MWRSKNKASEFVRQICVADKEQVAGAKMKLEVNRVYDFLVGLNSKFDLVRGRILGQKPIPLLMEPSMRCPLIPTLKSKMGSLFQCYRPVLTIVHLINRMSSRNLHLQTSFECPKKSYPTTQLIADVPLRVVGCTAFVLSHDGSHFEVGDVNKQSLKLGDPNLNPNGM